MAQAIAYELATAGWKAGNYTLAYQSCDDSTPSSGRWDAGTCGKNAAAFAANATVVGVIGPSNSGCAQVQVPALNHAPNGPLGMVSPANTYVGLTHSGIGAAAGEPGKYYPSGTRNYVRLVAPDDFQGAADATLAKQLGVSRLFVLNDKEAYGLGMAENTAATAKKLGLKVVRSTAYDPAASSYSGLAKQIQASGAQAVFIGGLISGNGGRLIRDLRAGAPGVTLLAPAGFTPIADVVRQSGGAAEGMYVSVAGLPVSKLPAAGQAFAKAFGKTIGGTPDAAAVYAAQAADVLLQAIADSDGTRAGVASQLFKVDLKKGIVGAVAFGATGDVADKPVTIYRIVHGVSTVYKVIVPATSLVAAP
jgi:branched-chain amino acid transport system substrate-binding protein